MSLHTWGWEQDPRLSPPDTYCIECGELIDRHSMQLNHDKWVHIVCIQREDDGDELPL